MSTDTEPTSTRGVRRRRLGRYLEARALSLAAVATAALLLVVLYFPVGVVFVQAITDGGRLTLAPVAAALTDPFYFGVLADVFANPLAVGRHLRALAGWVAAGFPTVRTGLFGFTAYQAALSTVASVAIGLPGAYVLARFEFPGRTTLRSLTILPFVLPGIMVAIGFFAMFGTRGLLNDALGVVGVGPIPFVEDHALAVIILAHVFYNAPLVTRVTTAAAEAVDTRTLETARSLGAGPRRAALDVVVPQVSPAVATGALLTFIFTFMTFPIVLAIGGLDMATVEVWVYARVQDLDLQEAAALAVLETILSLAITYAYLRFEARSRGQSRAANPPERDPLVPDLRSLLSAERLAVVGYGLVVVVVFLGPIASMVAESLTAASGGFTTDHYAFLLQRQATGASFQTKPLPAIENSLLFGVGTLAVAVPMGVVVAYVTTRGGRWGTAIETLTMLPLAVSGIVFGIGLLQGLVFGIPLGGGWRLQVTGPMAIVAAHAVAAYPFVVRNVAPLLASVDRTLVESARALGATRARALVDVELPLVWSGVVAGAAFAFAISVGEFDSTVILASGGGSYTMPVAVERYLGQRFGPAMAMGTVLLVITGASFVVVERLGGRAERG